MRLRRSLCSAWKAKAAGFEKSARLSINGRIYFIQTNEQFATFLTDVALTDIENNKCNPFEADIVLFTPRPEEAFNKVKSVFRNLDADKMLAYLNAFHYS